MDRSNKCSDYNRQVQRKTDEMDPLGYKCSGFVYLILLLCAKT